MSKEASAAESERIWRHLMADGRLVTVKWGQGRIRIARAFYGRLPTEPRCKFCHAPFGGVGGVISKRVFGRQPSSFSMDLCNRCEYFARTHTTGTEIGMSLVFADIRGSTALAEEIGTTQFIKIVDRFYRAATTVLVKRHALIEKLAGDQVSAAFVPGFVGQDHAARAIESGSALLKATGHAEEEGPWVPVGVGVHTGQAYIGTVGGEQMTDVVVLGDAANVAARLASVAAAGQVVVSADALMASHEDWSALETRSFELKGKAAGVQAGIIRIGPELRSSGSTYSAGGNER